MEKVLVIEDDHANRLALTSMLRHSGYAVESAADIPSALELWHTFGCDFKHVISDFNLFGHTSEEILPLFKSECPEINIVLLSGRKADELPPGLLTILSALLLKPVFFDEVLKTLIAI